MAVFMLFATCDLALATDPAANTVVRLFMDVCLPNMGRPSNVRAWAVQHQLAKVTNPAVLAVFVGSGDKGAAWAIPGDPVSFFLSIRGTSEACAVWARSANPDDVQTSFKKIVEGVKRPGVEVKIEQDTRSASQFGEIHALSYSMVGMNQPSGFLLTLVTAERPGAGYQISMQAAVGRKP